MLGVIGPTLRVSMCSMSGRSVDVADTPAGWRQFAPVIVDEEAADPPLPICTVIQPVVKTREAALDRA